MAELDFAADAISNPQANTGPVIELARKMVKLELEIRAATEFIQIKSDELDRIKTEQMPDLMRSCSVTSLDLTSGWSLGLYPVFRASLPAMSTIEKAAPEESAVLAGRLEAGLKWLRANKAADVIRDTIKVDLGPGQAKVANAIMKFIKTFKVGAERSQKVHPSTLNKLLKEKIANGVDVPMDTFGVFSGEVAEVKFIAKKGEVTKHGQKATTEAGS